MCIGYRIIKYECECEYNWLTKQCTTHPQEHDGTTFLLPNRGNIPCEKLLTKRPCHELDTDQAVGVLELPNICPHCVERMHGYARHNFLSGDEVVALRVRFNKHATTLMDFALDCVLVHPRLGQPIMNTQTIVKKMRTLVRHMRDWDPNMTKPSENRYEKIRKWAADEHLGSSSDNAGEGSSRSTSRRHRSSSTSSSTSGSASSSSASGSASGSDAGGSGSSTRRSFSRNLDRGSSRSSSHARPPPPPRDDSDPSGKGKGKERAD